VNRLKLINVSSVSNLNNQNNQVLVLQSIDNPEVTHSNPPKVVLTYKLQGF